MPPATIPSPIRIDRLEEIVQHGGDGALIYLDPSDDMQAPPWSKETISKRQAGEAAGVRGDNERKRKVVSSEIIILLEDPLSESFYVVSYQHKALIVRSEQTVESAVSMHPLCSRRSRTLLQSANDLGRLISVLEITQMARIVDVRCLLMHPDTTLSFLRSRSYFCLRLSL